MNSMTKVPKSAVLTDGAEPVLADPAKPVDPGARDDAEQAWAAALAQMVRSELEPQRTFAPVMGSDVSLTGSSMLVDAQGERTAGRAEAVAHAGAAEGRGRTMSRIVLEVDAGRLGRVKFSVTRSDDGLKVLVGVADPSQRALVELERNTLLSALKTVGLRVASVSITSPEAAGTSLAQYRRGMNSRQVAQSVTAYVGRKKSDDVETEDGVNLVG